MGKSTVSATDAIRVRMSVQWMSAADNKPSSTSVSKLMMNL